MQKSIAGEKMKLKSRETPKGIELTHKRSLKIAAIISSMVHDFMLHSHARNRNQR